MSTNKGYKPHGYRSDDYMANLPNYNAIIEYAKDPNNELDIQYRDNYINIYYLGGSLLKLKGEGSMEFDEHYYYPPSKKFPISHIEALIDNDFSKINKSGQLSEDDLKKKMQEAEQIYERIKSSRDNDLNRLRSAKKEDVGQILSEMKGVMKNWKGCKSRNAVDERTVQHYISLFNKEFASGSDFIVIDLEYKLSGRSAYRIPKHQMGAKKGQPRIDIVAIEKSTGQLYVLELKYGLKSTERKSGVVEHYDDYLKSVGAEDQWFAFWKDIKFLVDVQKKDNVLSKDVWLKEAKPIFGFVYKPEFSEDERDEFNQKLIKNNLSSIMTIYLPHCNYDNCNNPGAQTHLLKKP